MVALLLVAGALGATSAAQAQTTISGDKDTNAPLVINPDTDPVVRDLSAAQQHPVVFVQRMPVTKTSNHVTLGDFAKATGCSGTVNVWLTIREQEVGFIEHNYSAPSHRHDVVQSSTPTALGASLGQLSWNIANATLLAGHTYTFELTFTGDTTGGCATVRQRTWAHNNSQVEGGPDVCQDLPGVTDQSTWPMWTHRMWHEQGSEDFKSCPGDPGHASGTIADWPSGWVVVTDNNGFIYSPVAAAVHHEPADARVCGDPLTGGGAEGVLMNVSPDDYWTYGCIWPHFLAPGVETAGDWFYALPLDPQRDGAPRDPYLKLDTIDYDALLEQYSPVLQYDSAEPYPAEPADAMPAYAAGTCGSFTGSEWRNSLWSAADTAVPLASADECGGLPALSVSWLAPAGATYPTSLGRTPTASADDHLDEADDNYRQASGDVYRDAAAQQGTGDTVYARAYQDSQGTLWLEYWIWFYYNNGENAINFDNHEGDWEHVNVRLGSDLAPAMAVYGEHTYASKCVWGDVESSGDRPVVYVALGRHASWFASGEFGDHDDNNDGLGARVTPHTELVSGAAPSWVQWPGRWGSTNLDVIGGTFDTQSPPGPAFQSPWSDPAGEESSAQTTNCPSAGLSQRKSRADGDQAMGVPHTDGSVAAPEVTIQERRGQLEVEYTVPRGEGRRRLLLSVRPQSSALSEVKTISLRHVVSGTAHLRLPTGSGPYVFSASVLGRAGRSATIQRQIP